MTTTAPTPADLSGPLVKKIHGRNHSYRFGTVKVPGVTTITGCLDKPALTKWAAGCAAAPVADVAKVEDGHLILDGDELWARLRALDSRMPLKPTRSKLEEALTWAHKKDRDIAANRGTEVHRIAEKLVADPTADVKIPDELAEHVDAFIAWWEEWQPEDPVLEFSVGARRWGGWAGTGDLIATLPGLGRCLIDYKTNRSGPFGEVALQLAGYRFAEVILIDGVEQPMPEIDWCGALWIKPGGAELFPYVVDEGTLLTFAQLRQVHDFVKEPHDADHNRDRVWAQTSRLDPIRREDVDQ